MTESLNDQFAALHATRVATWEPAHLQRNVDQRAGLVAAFDPAEIVRPGDRAPDFTLVDTDGVTLGLAGLIAGGPLVLIFFRHAACPACNLALPYYARTLYPHLGNARLVAVSPQLPDRLAAISERHALPFTVASDPDGELAAAWNIRFDSDAAAVTGATNGDFPYPAVVIVDEQGTVRFVDASPDWLVRTETPRILAALGALRFADAA